jgi:hypothetical protein
MSAFKKSIASLLVVSTLTMGVPMGAQARLIETGETLAVSEGTARSRVDVFMAREDVLKALQSYGVSAEQARGRIRAMTDTEIQQLAGKIEQMPAGGEILGIMFTLFIVLLVTDILGLTKVFPFTRSAR